MLLLRIGVTDFILYCVVILCIVIVIKLITSGAIFKLLRIFVKMFIIWSLVATSIIYFGSKASGHDFTIFKSFGMAVGIGWTEIKKGINESSETITSPQEIDDAIIDSRDFIEEEYDRHSKYSKEDAMNEVQESFNEYNKN